MLRRRLAQVLALLGALALSPRTASARKPVHAPNLTSTEALTCTVNYSGTTGNLVYQGGAVVSNVQAIPVFWTSAVDPAIQAWAEGYLTALTNSAYIDMLAEYSSAGQAKGTGQTIGRGTAGPAVTITPIMLTGTTVNDGSTQIATELQAQITAGHLPAPAVDAQGRPNTVYVVFFPPGTTVNDGTGNSCTSWCAYHNEGGRSGNINYAVIPDMGSTSACHTGCDDQCTTDNVGISLASVSHELAEAITDPSRGWADPSGNGVENGDICTTKGGVQKDTDIVPGTTIKAQYIWSERYKECLLAPPGWDGGTPPSDGGSAQEASVSSSGSSSGVGDAGAAGSSAGSSGGGSGGASSAGGSGGVGAGNSSGGGSGGSSGGGAGNSGMGSGSGGAGAAGGDSGGGGEPFMPAARSAGCACNAGPTPVSAATGFVPLALVGVLCGVRRRRRA